jgi:hypothetical protein
MKTTLFSTVSALALTGLCFTLTPSTLSAHDGGRGAHHTNGKTAVKATPKGSSRGGSSRGSSNRSCSTRGSHGGHGRTCSSLPHGCRATNYHGHHCWYGNGHYYGTCADGGYEILDDQTDVDTTVVDTTVDTTVVDQPVVADDTDDVTVSVLPSDAEVTYVGGEQCWYSNGCYYHRSGHGFCKSHCKDKGGRVCKTGKGSSKGGSMSSRNRGARCKAPTGKSRGSSRSTGHSSGHSSGHGRK